MNKVRTTIIAIALAAVVAQPALAQRAPLLEGPGETRPKVPPLPDAPPEPAPSGRLLPPLTIPPDDPEASVFADGKLSIRAFQFSGNRAFSDAELAEICAPYLGEGRRYAALLEARDRITRAYIDAGYISSGAVLPEQSFADGVVEIQIVEGWLSKIDVRTSGRLRSRYVSSRLEGPDTALNVAGLRQRLQWLKRDPRIDGVTAELSPGQQPGESLLSVVIDEARPWWVSADADNYAAPAIGAYRGAFRAGHRNVTGWGDNWTVGYSVAEGLHDLNVQLEIPLTRWDTTLELRARRAWSEITEAPLDVFDIESQTGVFGWRLQQPILRESAYELRAFVGADWKIGRSFFLGEPGFTAIALPGEFVDDGLTRLTVLRLGGEGWWRGRKRAAAARVSANFGIDALHADDEFVSALFQLQAVEYLPWFQMRLHARLDAQVADAPLLGLEQFAVGGHASVRGFRENLFVRDQGIVSSFELRVPLPTWGPIERLELGYFSDFGYARNRGSQIELPSGRVWSLGFGLHADVTRYVSASLEWGGKILRPTFDPGNDLQDHGVHFSLQARFP